MSDRAPIPLVPALVPLDSRAFAEIGGWPFADPFVSRLLRTDIPRRVWTYFDPAGQPVGFGTLDVCDDWREFTGGRPHPYIPLLATNPTVKSLGYGTTILRHLVEEAALLASRPGCHDELILDVYTTSEKAIKLYTDGGFRCVIDGPRADPAEGGKEYIVMARRVSVAPGL